MSQLGNHHRRNYGNFHHSQEEENEMDKNILIENLLVNKTNNRNSNTIMTEGEGIAGMIHELDLTEGDLSGPSEAGEGIFLVIKRNNWKTGEMMIMRAMAIGTKAISS
jgi:hypothetical protein